MKSVQMAMALTGALVISSPSPANEFNWPSQSELVDLILQSAIDEGVNEPDKPPRITREEAERRASDLADQPHIIPDGRVCWATEVVSYNPGNPEPWPQFSNTDNILHEPDGFPLNHALSFSIGNSDVNANPPNYGEVVIKFAHKFTAEDPDHNLYLYEVGTDVEAMWVQLGDGTHWWPDDPGLEVAGHFTATSLDNFGVPPNTILDRVRIRDKEPNDGNFGAPAAGADVDAVAIDCKALPVTLDYLTVTAQLNNIRLIWKTGIEFYNAGMHVWRAQVQNGQFINIVRLTDQYIGTDSNAMVGNIYSYIDNSVVPNTTYYYAIEDMGYDGTSHFHLDKIASATTPQ